MSPAPSDILLRAQTDERLAALAGQGSERAFVVLVERHRAGLYAAALRLVPLAQAEDAVQQALLNAFTALRAGAEVRHVRAWLQEILRNAALRQLARRVEPEALDEALTTAGTHDAYSSFQTRASLRATLAEIARLPDAQRLALLETAVGGRGQREVAAELGTSEGGVRQLVHRARQSLRAAATALIPWPLAQRLADISPGEAAAGSAAGAGAGAGIGIGLKATGALLAAGAISTAGLVVTHDQRAKPVRDVVQQVAPGVEQAAAGDTVPSSSADRRRGADQVEDSSSSRRHRGHGSDRDDANESGRDRSGSGRDDDGGGDDGDRHSGSDATTTEDRSGSSGSSGGDDDTTTAIGPTEPTSGGGGGDDGGGDSSGSGIDSSGPGSGDVITIPSTSGESEGSGGD